ncbi:hypothetical protein, partial [Methylobacterium isbiliense]|nr:hypothetical protein [Methylobacterium isbiliense]
VGAILLEQSDEWAVQRSRYMTLESIAPLSDDADLAPCLPPLITRVCSGSGPVWTGLQTRLG